MKLLLICLFLFVSGQASAYGMYDARVIRVLDGDTLELSVSVWPGVYEQVKVRLLGVDTPEIHFVNSCSEPSRTQAREAGLKSKAYVEKITNGITVKLDGVAFGMYAGRVVGNVWLNDLSLADMIIINGYGRAYDGGKRQLWCELSM